MWRWVNTSECECVQVKVSAYKWRRVNRNEREWIEVKVSEYKWRWVRTSEGEWIQVKVSAYKWRWVNTSENECLQVKLSAYTWRWVRTSEGECIKVNVSEYKCMEVWVDLFAILGYIIHGINIKCSICMLAWSSYPFYSTWEVFCVINYDQSTLTPLTFLLIQ